MSENYTHWIGLVPFSRQRGVRGPHGAALAVVDLSGRLTTLATVRAPYAEETDEGFETLDSVMRGDWEGLRGAEWRPLVVLDRFSPAGRSAEQGGPGIRTFTAGLLLGYLRRDGGPFVSLPRRLWIDAAIAGERHPARGGSREKARMAVAAERWSRFRNARTADQHHAEAALLADVGRQRFRSSEAVA